MKIQLETDVTHHHPPANDLYDVAVIGAGVVGCAVARRFTLHGAKVIVLERGADILSGASKANSAILHTGFDAPERSLELACMQSGYEEYLRIARDMNLGVLETGAMVVAWTREELARLDAIEAQALANGVTDVRRMTPAEVLQREPNIRPAVMDALLVPREHVIDPWSAPLAYLTQAVQNGARLLRNAEVLRATDTGSEWHLTTPQEDVRARFVINCAGLYGDHVEQRLLGTASFSILPRKGQFVVFDKAASSVLRTILLPVPTERTKGVVVTRTAFGNVLVGPTAEEQTDRAHAELDEATLQTLVNKAGELVPALASMPVTATYAGLRPATESKAYRVQLDVARRYLLVGGIRSTGLTAALGLATHAFALYAGVHPPHSPIERPLRPLMPNLCEHRPRAWQAPGASPIVCHCELVTEDEITAAMQSDIPAGDFGGLRRRTRVCMGRCQGFYCGARVAAMTAGRLANALACEEAENDAY